MPQRGTFLSCLLGSERFPSPAVPRFPFLSCLLGSERCAPGLARDPRFLSCLLGSEHSSQQTCLAAEFSELPTRQ